MTGVMGSPSDAFERALFALATDEETPPIVDRPNADEAELVFPENRRVFFVRYREMPDASLARKLDGMIARIAFVPVKPAPELEIVVFGGPVSIRTVLGARPIRSAFGRIAIHHVIEGETSPWSSAASTAQNIVKRIARGTDGIEVDPARLEAKIEADRAHASDRRPFYARVADVVPLATYGLIAVIAIVFVLEQVLDATHDLPSLVLMGALVSSRVLRPPYEWWRIGASMFLHGGHEHVLLNGYVLFVLGRSMERILGTARFLILFFVSGIAGGLASAALMRPEPSVGASGCLWGLLAAEAVLAFRPHGLIPTGMLAISKRAAITNLALNVAVSFFPHVDWAAHLGGGLAGGALMLTGVLARGLPRMNVPEDLARPSETRVWIPTFATALSVSALACVPVAIARGRPNALQDPPVLARRSFLIGERARISAEIPDAMTEATDPGGAVFGDIMVDPALIEIRIFGQDPPVTPEQEPAWRDRMLETLAAHPPNGYTAVGPPDPKTISGHSVVVAYFAAESLQLERSFLLLGARVMARVDVLVWKKYAVPYAGFAERVIDSLRVEEVD